MASGLIRVIATSHPTLEVDVLASPRNAPVLEGNPYVRRVLRFDRRRVSALPSVLRALRRGHYDVVIDGMVLTPSVTTMLLMIATGAPYRIGVSGRENDFIYTLSVPPAPPGSHVVEHAAQTAIPFGVLPDRADWRSQLFLTVDELARAEAVWDQRGGAPRMLVNISAFLSENRWPHERYVAVLRHIERVRPDARTVVIADPAEQDEAAHVAAEGGAEFARTASVRDAFALVATADAVFTPDTSIAHAAAATGTSVAVMLRHGYGFFAPYRARGVQIESDGPTIVDLPVTRVLSAVEELLAMTYAR